jgi:TetR/AcrR family transcriptional regulator, mexJK operon transcriptional repressor
MNEQVAIARGGATQTGRPTREYARQRQEDLLERALEMFAEHGFEQTTIDAIAASMNMTKRTIYTRYKDKSELFEAAVKRSIERWFIPPEVLRSADTGDLESTLVAIARMRLDNNLSREGLRLQRIVTAEAFRFPEVFGAYEAVSTEVIQFLVEVFQRHRDEEAGEWFDDLELAASAFLSVVNTPARRALLFNQPPEPAQTERFIEKSVRLLLDGMRPR